MAGLNASRRKGRLVAGIRPGRNRVPANGLGVRTCSFPTSNEMKKPPKKSRKSRLHTAEEKAKHRNPQMPRLRKGSVHPVATNPQNPLPEPRKRTKRKRKPYKLHEATIKRLIASIDAHSDAPMYVHLRAAGIHPDTFNEWKGLAAENPDGMHAFFLERVDKALARAWGTSARGSG